MSKHTEGNWGWSGDQLLANRPRTMSSEPVLVTMDPFNASPADKALIALAPELLAFAQEVGRVEGDTLMGRTARDLVKRAQGLG